MTFENRYSRIDRLLHRFAFSIIGIQKVMADIEDRIYAKRFTDVKIDRPVFITSLPRAGTTLFLELISALDSFAVHTYRQMPFVSIPLLWHDISRWFQTSDTVRERAHGDGMTIGYDSPEAFEEIFWKAFWPEKYEADRIRLWKADDQDRHGEFEDFIHNHIRKLVVLRANGEPNPSRYVSKNNANMSRIATIARIFPDALILLLFRNPIDHVSSMLRQHRNFKEIHSSDMFARRYMEDIGHFDFGDNFRPINFNNWLDRSESNDADTPAFWMQYWCEAFDYVLSHPVNNAILISYDNCCENPESALTHIGEKIKLEAPEALVQQADRFRIPAHYDPDTLGISPSLLERANALNNRLLELSVT